MMQIAYVCFFDQVPVYPYCQQVLYIFNETKNGPILQMYLQTGTISTPFKKLT